MFENKQLDIIDDFLGENSQNEKEIQDGITEKQLLINLIDKLGYLSKIDIKRMNVDELYKLFNSIDKLNNIILKIKEQYKDV